MHKLLPKLLLSVIIGTALMLVTSVVVSNYRTKHYDPCRNSPQPALCDPVPWTPFGVPLHFGVRDAGFNGQSPMLRTTAEKVHFVLDVALWSGAVYGVLLGIQKIRRKSST